MSTQASSVHFVAVGLWLGALVLSGASAAIVFPTMKELAPKLDGYAAYTGEHWKLAGGMVQARVFVVADIVCAAAALLACFSLAIVWMRSRWGGWVGYGRIVALVLACGALGYQLFVLGPVMGQNLRQHWTLAAAGENDKAEAYRKAFETDHPKASGILYAQFGAVLVTLVLGLAHRPEALAGRAGK